VGFSMLNSLKGREDSDGRRKGEKEGHCCAG
jgi:hypothetical protein